MKDKTPGEYVAPQRANQPATSNQDYDYPSPDEKVVEYPEPDWSDDNPIPVYVVERPAAPEFLNWSSDRSIIGDTKAEQIAGARKNRTRIVLRNEGPDPVYIDVGQETMPAFSFRLALNEREEMFHNAAVWARCDPAKSATVSIIQEYTVPLELHK